MLDITILFVVCTVQKQKSVPLVRLVYGKMFCSFQKDGLGCQYQHKD